MAQHKTKKGSAINEKLNFFGNKQQIEAADLQRPSQDGDASLNIKTPSAIWINPWRQINLPKATYKWRSTISHRSSLCPGNTQEMYKRSAKEHYKQKPKWITSPRRIMIWHST
ncbi:Hypothetical predicted protein [Pelobates cultripes]|uniref:Uncharacterized protein n=1 Tax=Pelobates cultripes TaxID=61616 RepID=A0AAD1S6Z8_PELCU|nr:Hypothetical predicted protein [Pelobates cultripes]